MRRSAISLAVLCLSALGALAVYGQQSKEASRTFQFRYHTIVKDIPANAGKVEVWLPYPTSDAYQTIEKVAVDAPRPAKTSREGEYGNSILYVRVDNPSQREIPIDVTFTATRREYVHRQAGPQPPRPLSAAQQKRFLAPDRLVPIDGRIRELAMEVTKGKTTDLEKTRAIYEYVTKSVKYDKSGQGWGRGDALYVCDARAGNCTDFHALIIGMARASGMPAKFEIGFPLPAQRGAGEIPGYHCWAEVYTREAGWIPVDSSEASKNPAKFDYFFGALDENRVQLSAGRDLKLNPKQAGDPLNYFIYPYVEVDGKLHTAFDKQFSYTDKPASGTLSARPTK
jgi:transglutaminase-like putative cysteine protease